MPKHSLFRFLTLLVFVTAGCGAATDPVPDLKPAAPTTPQADLPPTTPPVAVAPKPDSDATVKRTALEEFLQNQAVCRDVLAPLSLADFLVETPTAIKDLRISEPAVGYVAYRDGMFTYEFLDEQLFAIRFILPRTRNSAREAMAPYRQTFGPATSTVMPQDLRDAKAAGFQSWDLPEHNLRVRFAYLPPSFAESDLNLFGQFINLRLADQLALRQAEFLRARKLKNQN